MSKFVSEIRFSGCDTFIATINGATICGRIKHRRKGDAHIVVLRTNNKLLTQHQDYQVIRKEIFLEYIKHLFRRPAEFFPNTYGQV